MYTLYDYYRSSASYRVRIVLNYKQVEYNKQEVHLVNNGGEQHSKQYKKINVQELVPSLSLNDQPEEVILAQSMAILEFLEEKHPEPSILPNDLIKKAQTRSLANIVACDIHPLNNLRVLEYLKNNFNTNEQQKLSWYHHWLQLGFAAYENNLMRYNNLLDESVKLHYSIDNKFTLADACLIPQVYNAMRFDLNLNPYPNILAIYQNCLNLPWVHDAQP